MQILILNNYVSELILLIFITLHSIVKHICFSWAIVFCFILYFAVFIGILVRDKFFIARIAFASKFTYCISFSRYCNILEKCKDAVFKSRKYATNPTVAKVLNQADNVCPPPKGDWTMTFSQVIRMEDIPDGFFGPIQSVIRNFNIFRLAYCSCDN